MTISELTVIARKWVRKTTTAYDEEIQQLIKACEIDLSNAGVWKGAINYNDAIVQEAFKLYIKSNFGNDENSEKFEKAYEHLKKALSISSEYNGRGDELDV